MTSIEKILDLMSKQGLNAITLTKELGLNHSIITEWKKGKAKPSADALSKIADYFDVSVDYLLGREEQQKKSTGFPMDFEMFRNELAKRNITENDFNNLTEEQKKSLFNVIKELFNTFQS